MTEQLWAELATLVCCAARLLPVVFLCPALGGQLTSASVKLGVVAALSIFVRWGTGVGLEVPPNVSVLVATAGRELMLGVGLGLLAGLPYDAVRIAGRWMDTFRGASAEALLPGVGTTESAMGHLLQQLTLALATASGGLALLVRALVGSFVRVPLGSWGITPSRELAAAALVGGAFSSAFALGAPVAAATLAADLTLALVAKAGSTVRFGELAAPLRLLLGAAVIYVAWTRMAAWANEGVGRTPQQLGAWLGGGP